MCGVVVCTDVMDTGECEVDLNVDGCGVDVCYVGGGGGGVTCTKTTVSTSTITTQYNDHVKIRYIYNFSTDVSQICLPAFIQYCLYELFESCRKHTLKIIPKPESIVRY